MRERTAFEHELSALARGGGASAGELQAFGQDPWLSCIGVMFADGRGPADGTISDPAALVDKKAVQLSVRYYPGRTEESALVFGGVHGDEDQGVDVTQALRKKLDLAYGVAGRKARFHTFLIENVRAARDAIQPQFKDDRWVEGKIEPNRNFPLAGEGFAAVAARNAKLKFDLVDPDTRRFPDLPPRPPNEFPDIKDGKDKSLKVDRTTPFLLAETRLLMTLVACIRPKRAVSCHAHSLSNNRGDAPGIFIDPRGGFDSDLDAPLTSEGRDDDALLDSILRAAKARIDKSSLTKDEKAAALAGNKVGNKSYLGETAHYSFGARKARGTSFGMWASAPIVGHGTEDRPAIQTITLEMPKWVGVFGKKASEDDKKKARAAAKAAVTTLAAIWAEALIEKFLEVQ